MNKTFKDLGLGEEILKAIGEMGYETPTPVQEKAIPQILANRQDVVALAQTGTGKTAAFSLPILEQIDTQSNKPQVLILSPTRELGIQIAKNVEQYTKYLENVKSVAVYGGSSIEAQIRQIKRGVQIVVGTPGRTLDLIRRKQLDFSSIRFLILDEADEMLSMGFSEDLNSILEGTPEDKQTLLFSATMPPEIQRIAQNYMSDYKEITVGSKNSGAKNVEHHYYQIKARDRYKALKRIVDFYPNIYGIVFCRTRKETKDVADSLMEEGYNSDAIHGDMSQPQREYVMKRFRNKQLQILVATDVAARGVDVNDLTHVINYNLPDDPEVYVHRSGRTGRAGKEGISVAIIHSREQFKLKQVQKMVGKQFFKKLIPSGVEICQKQLFSLIGKLQNVEIQEGEIADFLPKIYEQLEGLSREELIKKFVSLEFNRFLKYYENAPDLNISESKNKRERKDRSGRVPFARFHINVGKKHGITPKDIISLVNQVNRRDRVAIGQIEILKSFSFFEVDEEYAEKLPNKFKRLKFNGIDLVVEPSKPRERRNRGDRNFRSRKRDRSSSNGEPNRPKRNRKRGKKKKPF
jgi:ATP-dependent RNA helicase DeaD